MNRQERPVLKRGLGEKMLKKICVNIEEIIAGIALCIMSVATVFNVFCRLVLSKSYPWAEEISYFCFAWLIFVGASAVYKRYQHSSIDILVRVFPEKLKVVVTMFSNDSADCVYRSSGIFKPGIFVNAWTRKTPIMNIPYTFEALAMTVGFWPDVHPCYFLLHQCGEIPGLFPHKTYISGNLYCGNRGGYVLEEREQTEERGEER